MEKEKISKKTVIFSFLIAVLCTLCITFASAETLSPPDFPTEFSGTVHIDNEQAPINTSVDVYVDSSLVGTFILTSVGEYEYDLINTTYGSQIEFKINGFVGATETISGDQQVVNINVSTTVTSNPNPSNNQGSSGGGGSGGGSGGGGGGIGAFYVCNKEWVCGDWSSCTNGKQTRRCGFTQVPQHTSSNECQTQEDKPSTTRSCSNPSSSQDNNKDTDNAQTVQDEQEKTDEQSVAQQNDQSNQDGGLAGITGAATSPLAQQLSTMFTNPTSQKIVVVVGLLVLVGIFSLFVYQTKIKKTKAVSKKQLKQDTAQE